MNRDTDTGVMNLNGSPLMYDRIFGRTPSANLFNIGKTIDSIGE